MSSVGSPPQPSGGASTPRTTVVTQLTSQQAAQVLALAAACATADGRPALSEQTLLHAQYGEPATSTQPSWVLVETSPPQPGVLVGVAHWDPVGEMPETTQAGEPDPVNVDDRSTGPHHVSHSVAGDWAVAPWARGDTDQPSPVVAALLAGLRQAAPPGVAVDVWVHGTSSWSARALQSWEAHPQLQEGRDQPPPQLRLVRTLWQMRRPLTGPDLDLDAVPVPAPNQILVLTDPRAHDMGVLMTAPGEQGPIPQLRVRTFHVGVDEAPWLQLNARAFATHPEQGRWTAADLAARQREDWFDPAGFFIAERVSEASAPRMVGFHWTKIHPPVDQAPTDGTSSREDARPEPAGLGEVYVLGVDPGEQGTGLGRALARIGLAYLRRRGLPTAILYVEADNEPAVRLYTSLGFVHHDSDRMYRLI